MGLTSSTASSADESTIQWVEEKIHEQQVVVFSKTTCPYCSEAKKILDKTSANYKSHEINKMDNCSQIQDALQDKTGARTVPRVFIDGKSIGGCSDLKQLYSSGQLLALVQKSELEKAGGES